MSRKTILTVSVFFGGVLSLAFGQNRVAETLHNLSISGPGEFRSLDETEICVFCHTHHVALGIKNIVEGGKRQRKRLQDAVGDAALSYRWNFGQNEYSQTLTRAVTTTVGTKKPGKTWELENRFVWEHETADRILDYLRKRERYSDETLEGLVLLQDARGLRENELLEVTYPLLRFDHAVMQVQAVQKTLTRVTCTLMGWDASIYVYEPGELPEDKDRRLDILRIPRPGGLELVGPAPGTMRVVRDPFLGLNEHVVGLGNIAEFTGKNIRIRWHAAVPLLVTGWDEDNYQPLMDLVRDYLVTIIGVVEAMSPGPPEGHGPPVDPGPPPDHGPPPHPQPIPPHHSRGPCVSGPSALSAPMLPRRSMRDMRLASMPPVCTRVCWPWCGANSDRAGRWKTSPMTTSTN